MLSSESDIEALRAELEAEKSKVRLLEREIEAYKAGAKPGSFSRQTRGVQLINESSNQLNDFELSVLDLDMDVMDVCCVEVDWNSIVKAQSRSCEGIEAGMRSNTKLKRSDDFSKENLCVIGSESWRYRPFSDLDIQPVKDLKQKSSRIAAPLEISTISMSSAFLMGSVEYMSKSAAEVLVGEQFDQFHIMQFANASGQQSYVGVDCHKSGSV